MNNYNKQLIALVFATCAASSLYAEPVESSGAFQLSVTVRDQIQIDDIDSHIIITGDTISDWTGTTNLKVKHLDENVNRTRNYQLNIESIGGGSSEQFSLTHQDPTVKNTLDINIEYEAADSNTDQISYNSPLTALQTRQGLEADIRNSDDINLKFTIPAKAIHSAHAGNYSSDLTILVTAQ